MTITILPATNNTSIDNANVSIDPAASNQKKTRRLESNDANMTIPAGAYHVQVKHISPAGGTLTINGDEYSFNEIFHDESEFDRANNIQDFVPEVVISNPGGILFSVSVSFPSSNPFNPNTL